MISPLLSSLKHNFEQFADRPALEAGERQLTYQEMDIGSLYFAEQLAASGLGPGGQVVLWLPSSPEFFVSMIAAWRLNAVPVPLNPTAPAYQAREILQTLDPALVLVGGETEPPLSDLQTMAVPSLEGRPSGRLQETMPQADDLAALLFTSGSTGISKGVLLSHRVLGRNNMAMAKALGLSAEDRWLFNTPFTFTSAICHLFTNLMVGAAVKALDRFCFPQETMALINDFQATGFGGSPLQNRWLIEAVEKPDQMPALRRAMSSGDYLPEHTIRLFMERLPQVRLFNVYGMTEVGGRFCVQDPAHNREHLGSVGKPIDGLECTVREQKTAELLPQGQTGEIYAHGELMMEGYYRLPAQTQETLTEFGIRSGDLGYKNADGFLYIVGRRDDVFKSSGEKVSALLIQRTLLETNLFKDVVVMGVPDEYLGQVPKVFYVLKPGQRFDRKSTLAWLKERLPSSHVPHQFEALAEIPRTGSGKVDRQKLRQMTER